MRLIQTSEQAHGAIEEMIGQHMWAALRTDYDSKISVAAVSAADQLFRREPIVVDPKSYVEALVEHLIVLRDSYMDPDGQHMIAREKIGSVVVAVERVLRQIAE